jgi:hypothetical protein
MLEKDFNKVQIESFLDMTQEHKSDLKKRVTTIIEKLLTKISLDANSNQEILSIRYEDFLKEEDLDAQYSDFINICKITQKVCGELGIMHEIYQDNSSLCRPENNKIKGIEIRQTFYIYNFRYSKISQDDVSSSLKKVLSNKQSVFCL